MSEETLRPIPSQQELARNVLGIKTEQDAVRSIAPAFHAFYGIDPEFPIDSEQSLEQSRNAKLHLLLVLLANGATTIDDGMGMLFGLLRGQAPQETGLGKYRLSVDTSTLREETNKELCMTLSTISQHKKIKAMFAPQATTEYDTDNIITDRLQRKGWDVKSTTYRMDSITPDNNPFTSPYATGSIYLDNRYAIASLPMKTPTNEFTPHIKMTIRRNGTPDNPQIIFENLDLSMWEHRLHN